jgi:hypothetical protein
MIFFLSVPFATPSAAVPACRRDDDDDDDFRDDDDDGTMIDGGTLVATAMGATGAVVVVNEFAESTANAARIRTNFMAARML